MPPDTPSDVKFEIGHVLFIDIVGYSKGLINEQSDSLQKLKEIVRGTEQFRLAEAEGKLLRLPTGDGGALVFRNTPEAPVLCAMEIARALRSYPQLRVRMGIHSGPVNEVTDLNEQANIAGAGINLAQRVMDCGDVGHILLSRHVAEDLEHYPRWQAHLHELGECEVKHGLRIGVVSLYTEGIGNPQTPKKLQVLKKQRTRSRWIIVATALLLLAGVIAAFVIVSKRSTSAIQEKSVAVLPFENLSEDKANAYFADGIQDEILTKLASIADLKVISRTSTAKYKSKPEDLRTVSQQLGVATVVEGTVQRAAEKVRVNVQLIDARADTHLWAKSYDREARDIFAVESEVSQGIADALQAKLSPHEATTLATAPTRDPVAYDLFLKGEFEEREAETLHKAEAYDQAAAWYQQAIARDPSFALAIARLAESRINRHWFLSSLTEDQLAQVKSTAEHALALAPNLAEAHIALGLCYYYSHRQFDQALSEFRRAIELQPNNARALEFSGAVHRRQGRWELGLSELDKADDLDPRDASIPGNVGVIYVQLRMWKEANRAGTHALALDPHDFGGMISVLLSCLNGTGDIKEAKRIMTTFPPETRLASKVSGDLGAVISQRAYLSVIERDFQTALKIWEQGDPAEKRERGLAAEPAIHVLAGDTASAMAEIEEARDLLEARLRERPNDIDTMTQLSWVYVALKRNTDALNLARQATRLLPLEKDAYNGTGIQANLAEVEAQTGEISEAVKTLRQLLSIPAGICVSIARLKIDPVWDPIRSDPGFQQLLAGKELIGPNK